MALVTSIIAAVPGLAAARGGQSLTPSLTLSALTVKAGGALIATGNCGGITTNVVPAVYVSRVNGQTPPGPYDDLVKGAINPDGSFKIVLTLPSGVLPGQYSAQPLCTLDGDQLFYGDEVRFTVTPADVTTSSSSTTTTMIARPTPAPEPAPASPVEASPGYTG